jgi:hypothetical protein
MPIKKTSRIKTITLFISPLLFIFLNSSFSNTSAFARENNDNNYKYDREYLQGRKNEFIINNGDLIIREFIIRGTKKTRPSLILNQTDTKPGQPLSTFNSHEFINRLKKKNIFSDIEINYINDSGAAVIEVILTEKWTIIPIPMFSSNSRNTAYGLYILESNLMGYGKTLFTGGTWSNSGWSGILGYIDPSLFSTNFRLNLFLIYKSFIYQNGNLEGELLSEYKSVEKNARLDLGYGFKNRYFIYLSGGYESHHIDSSYKESFNTPQSQENLKAGLLFNINRLKYYEYFFYGFVMQSGFYGHIPADKNSSGYMTSEFKMDWSFKVFSFHRISLSAFGFCGDTPPIAEKRIGGKQGFRTIPADIITSDKYASGTVSYEFPFLRYKWGAVTLLSFWEQGIFKSDEDSKTFHGTGAGILFYMKRLAIPALGFNYARNLKTETNEFSVSAGFTF